MNFDDFPPIGGLMVSKLITEKGNKPMFIYRDERKGYEVIYGSSIVDKEVIQIALYFDIQEDESWAIETWKNIKKKKDVV